MPNTDSGTLRKDIENDVRQSGRSVMCIFGDADGPTFAYAIGNALKGLPELLLVGTTKGELLNDLSQKMIDRGRAFDDGELVSLGGKFPLKVITANDDRAKRVHHPSWPVSWPPCSKFSPRIATGAIPTTRSAKRLIPPSLC
jgi:hypothetical protein